MTIYAMAVHHARRALLDYGIRDEDMAHDAAVDAVMGGGVSKLHVARAAGLIARRRSVDRHRRFTGWRREISQCERLRRTEFHHHRRQAQPWEAASACEVLSIIAEALPLLR